MPGDPGLDLSGKPINRYLDLINEIPKGTFYGEDGIRVPYQGSKPYDLIVQTSEPVRVFGVFVNGKFKGTVTTNSDGVARFSTTLDPGRNDIVLEDDVTGKKIKTYLSAYLMHVAHAALAEVIESIDESIQDTLNDRRIEVAERNEIEDVWGKRLLHSNTPGYQLSAYREMLQEVHQGYRMFGGRQMGLDDTVSSIATVTPLRFPFRSFGPRWCLGNSFLRNADFQERDRTQWTRTSAIPGITIVSAGPANQRGNGTLTFSFATQSIRWTTPGGVWGPGRTINQDGRYTLTGPWLPARFDGRVNGPFNIVAATNDRLRLNLNGVGTINITLTAGAARTAVQVAADINAALTADTRYGVAYGAVASALTTQRVRLQTPGGTAGVASSITLENVTADAYFTIFGYPWVRSTLLNPEIIGSVSLELASSDDFRSADADNTYKVVIARGTVREELVTISGNNTTTDVLTVPAPGLALAKNAGDVVEQYSAFPHEVRGSNNEEQGITIDVDASALPVGNDTETVALAGSNIPDGWLTVNVAQVANTMEPYGWFDFYQYAASGTGVGDITIEARADERVWQYREWPFTFSVWLRNRHTAAVNVRLGVNFGTGWVESGVFVIPSINADGGDKMTFCSYGTILPATATEFRVRVRHVGTGAGETIELARAVLRQPNVTALNLGINTTPRSGHRAYLGELIYIWSPNQLATSEKDIVGLSSPSKFGHVDYVLPAHVEGDRFDVTEYTAGVAKNVKGAFTEADLYIGTKTNMTLYVRTPARRSFMAPSRISLVQGERLSFPTPPVAPYVATLAVSSNQDQAAAMLFENGVLVPNNRWQFDSATQIRVLSGYNSGALYTIDYQALIQFETSVIDLGGAFADYVWYVDLHTWSRFEPILVTTQRTVQAVFDLRTRRAMLADRSDRDKTASTLIENNGLEVRTVPARSYQYIDSRTIRINADQFKSNAVYFFTFNALRVSPTRVPTITIERRRATTVLNLLAAPYVGTEKDEVLPATGRYLQYRISINNVQDTRDFRLIAASAKGLGLLGAGLTVPILRP